MREFKTLSTWNNKENKWVESYTINDEPVDEETFMEEMEDETFSEEEISDDCPKTCAECEGCAEKLTDEEEEEINLLCEFTDKILDTEGCPHCIFGIVMDIFYAGKEIGFANAKDYMRSCLDDTEE